MYHIANPEPHLESLTHAMDEIYSLRAIAADCANRLESLLELRTLSRVRRQDIEKEITRLRACARGEWKAQLLNSCGSFQDAFMMDDRILRALSYAEQDDGGHHKDWAIDQMVRALLGCPMVPMTKLDWRGVEYSFEIQGESEEYLAWIAAYCDGEDGPETYGWSEGIAP